MKNLIANAGRQAPLLFIVLTLALLWATGALHLGAPAGPDVVAEAHGPGDGHGHGEAAADHAGPEGEDHSCEEHGALEELAELTCEHETRTIDCDACRFEVGVVKVGDELANALLETAPVTTRPAADRLSLTGEVRLDRSRVVDVPPNAAGRVLSVPVDLGQRVRAGEVLAVIHSGELGGAKAAYLKAWTEAEIAEKERERQVRTARALDELLAALERQDSSVEEIETPDGLVGEWKAKLVAAAAALRRARLNHEREHRLHEKGISSEVEHERADEAYASARAGYSALAEEVTLSLDLRRLRALNADRQARAELLAAEQRLRVLDLDDEALTDLRGSGPGDDFARLTIRAPRDGTIVRLEPAVGRYVGADETLVTIADLSKLWVWCDLYERDLGTVAGPLAAGRTLDAGIRVRSFPDRVFPGTLDVVGSEMDEHTRTVRARIRVDNPERLLRPGMFAEIDVAVPAGGRVRVVPRTAVLTDEGRAFVFQQWRDDYWVRRPVVVRASAGDHVEIEGDVPVGALVASGGAFMLKSDVLREKMGAG